MTNTSKITQPNAIVRELANRVQKYYLKGLTQIEIAKLLDVSVRTVQRIQTAKEFRKSLTPVTESQRAKEMQQNGYTYPQNAKELKCSKAKVGYLLKKENECTTTKATNTELK